MSKTFDTNLSWGERLAIVEHFGFNDEQATASLGVTQDELSTARELVAAGSITVTDGIDFSQYEELRTTAPNSTTAPITATKPAREAKKRGRKGDKIRNAFLSIPSTPTPAEEFITTHGISMNVLRQGKRFAPSELEGTIRVRKSKETGLLMVWREEPSE